MLNIELDEENAIAILSPDGELTEGDFEAAARIIDPMIEARGVLNGLAIHVREFPGWESFASLVAHLKFVRSHHEHVARIAFATDSAVGALAETLATHFVSAEIRHFRFNDLDEAKSWLSGNSA